MKTLKNLKLIFNTTFGALIILFLVAFVIANSPNYIAPALNVDFIYLKMGLILMILVAVPITFSLPKKRFSELTNDTNVSQKLALYKSLFLIKIAIYEGLSLASIVTYMITKEHTYLYSIGLTIVLIILAYPTANKVCDELNIEEIELENN